MAIKTKLLTAIGKCSYYLESVKKGPIIEGIIQKVYHVRRLLVIVKI